MTNNVCYYYKNVLSVCVSLLPCLSYLCQPKRDWKTYEACPNSTTGWWPFPQSWTGHTSTTDNREWEQLRGMFRRLPDKVGRGESHVRSVSRDNRKVVGGPRNMPTWCTQGTPFRRSNSCSREVVLKTCIAYSGTPVYDKWREEMNYSAKLPHPAPPPPNSRHSTVAAHKICIRFHEGMCIFMVMTGLIVT